MSEPGEDVSAVSAIVPVSRETAQKLEAYAALIGKWQGAVPVIAPGDMPALWRRHLADSAQLVRVLPGALRWVDIGSGAGLPGLVVAVVSGEGTHVDLIEANRRRAAFLRAAIRETGAPATVHEGRAEALLAEWRSPADAITARAVAPLARLFDLAWPLMETGVPAAFFKGRDFEREISEATHAWEFDLVKHESRIGEGGVILEVNRLRRKRR